MTNENSNNMSSTCKLRHGPTCTKSCTVCNPKCNHGVPTDRGCYECKIERLEKQIKDLKTEIDFRISGQVKMSDDYESQIRNLKNNILFRDATIQNQNEEIVRLNNEVKFRNETIRIQDLEICRLKNEVKELEKFKPLHRCNRGISFPDGKVYCIECGKDVSDTPHISYRPSDQIWVEK